MLITINGIYKEKGGEVSCMGLKSDIRNTIQFHFLYADKYSFGTSWDYSEKNLPYNLLRYMVRGKAEFIINGKRSVVKEGEIIYVPMGCTLQCKAMDEKISFISIRFTTSVFYEGADFMEEYFGVIRTICATQELKENFEHLYEWVHREEQAKQFWIRGYLDLIIGGIVMASRGDDIAKSEAISSQKESKLEKAHQKFGANRIKSDPRIQFVMDYIVLHAKETYTIAQLSEMAGVAETTFRKLFKAQTGKAPNAFMRELKLTTAAKELLKTSDSVNSIAYEVGFEDPNYFSRMFKKTFGVTPNEYRIMARG